MRKLRHTNIKNLFLGSHFGGGKVVLLFFAFRDDAVPLKDSGGGKVLIQKRATAYIVYTNRYYTKENS